MHFALYYVVAQLVITIVHEFGHALPALLFTKGKVKIIIGVSKDKDNHSINIITDRLETHIKINPFTWLRGYCSFDWEGLSKWQSFFILANGSVLTFITAIFFCFFMYIIDLESQIFLFSLAFFIASLISLFTNLIPSDKPFYYNGIKMYNDGYLIKTYVFKKTSYHDKFNKAIEYHLRFNQKREAADECYKAIQMYPKERYYYQKLITFLYEMNLDEEMSLALEKMQKAIGLDNYSFNYRGFLQLRNAEYEKAEASFTYAIMEYDGDYSAYNNRGYTRGLMEKYKDSITDLNESIKRNHSFAYAYNNRAYAFIMTDQMARAYDDLSRSMELDVNNAYCFRNFGIYFLKKGQKDIARIYLKKARDIDSETLLLEKYEELCAE